MIEKPTEAAIALDKIIQVIHSESEKEISEGTKQFCAGILECFEAQIRADEYSKNTHEIKKIYISGPMGAT